MPHGGAEPDMRRGRGSGGGQGVAAGLTISQNRGPSAWWSGCWHAVVVGEKRTAQRALPHRRRPLPLLPSQLPTPPQALFSSSAQARSASLSLPLRTCASHSNRLLPPVSEGDCSCVQSFGNFCMPTPLPHTLVVTNTSPYATICGFRNCRLRPRRLPSPVNYCRLRLPSFVFSSSVSRLPPASST